MSALLPQVLTARDLADRLDGRLHRGDPEVTVARLASLDSALAGDVAYLSSVKHRESAQACRASVLIVTEPLLAHVPADCAAIVVADPYVCYAMLARWIDDFRQQRDAPAPGIHPAAVIEPGAQIGADVRIGPGVLVSAQAVIGDGSWLAANVVIGRRSRLGRQARLFAGVAIYDDCQVGDRVRIHSGTVIGSDGFGFAPHNGAWAKIPQLGRVIIGDDVEIGSNCSIDRGALDDTVIGNGCKLDNLIQVAHNVRIGEHTALAGCVGIAGSAVIGKRCQIGGSAGILGHLEICDDVVISAMTLVAASINEPGRYSGVYPLMTHAAWKDASANLRQLPRLRDRVRHIEQQSGIRR